jgi:hypothetical protein
LVIGKGLSEDSLIILHETPLGASLRQFVDWLV